MIIPPYTHGLALANVYTRLKNPPLPPRRSALLRPLLNVDLA